MTPAKYVPPTDLLLGRVILVTGATGGIGRAVSMACAIHGATVVLHGRDQAKLDQLYDALRSGSGTEPAALPLDLAGATEQTYVAAKAAFGGEAQSPMIAKLLEDLLHTDLRAPGFPARLE